MSDGGKRKASQTAPQTGWTDVPVAIPDFAHKRFEKLREDYADKYGVTPSQPQVVAALSHVATVASLKTALLAYRDACKKHGVKHGREAAEPLRTPAS